MSQPTWWRGGRGLPSLIAMLHVEWHRMKINIAASQLYYHEPHFNYDPSRVNYEHALLGPDFQTNMLKFHYIINVI